MKNQELKKILDAVGIVLIFFATKCRGGSGLFNGNIHNGIWHPCMGENGAENVTVGLYPPFMPTHGLYWNKDSFSNRVNDKIDYQAPHEQYAVGGSVYGHPFDSGYNMPGTSRDQNVNMRSANGLVLPSAVQASVSSLSYDEYSPRIPANEMQYQYGQTQQPMPESSAVEYPFNQACNVSGASSETDKSHDLRSFITDQCVHSLIPDGCETFEYELKTEEQAEQEQCIAHGSASNKKIVSNIAAMRRKRKESLSTRQPSPKSMKSEKEEPLEEKPDIVSVQQESGGIEKDATAQTQKKHQLQRPRRITKKRKIVENSLGIKLWNDRRLTNKRRANYKSHHKIIYTYRNSRVDPLTIVDIESDYFQEKIKKGLESFSAHVAPLIKQNALWYFIASRTTNINTKHKDLLWLKELLSYKGASRYKEMVIGLEGYYPGVAEDMIGYLEKHRPLRVTYESPTTVWKETLGDVYIQKGLEINYSIVLDQDKISQIDRKYSVLAYALCMILALPEVHQDFSHIRAEFIEGTRMSENLFINKQKQEVLLSIHALVQEAADNNKKTENEYENIHCALESIYSKDAQKEPTVSGVYKEIYTILVEFYARAKVIDAREYILLGKCAIKHQKYIKCKAVLGFVSEKAKPSAQAHSFFYSLEMDKWDVSPGIEAHYHVYYVDNALQHSRMLCMPIYVDKSGKEHCLHTIGTIVKHIKMLYGIEITSDVIHPFKVNKETKEWSYIKDKDKDLTVKDLPEYKIVFYRIEDDLRTTKFVFAEFTSLMYHRKDSISIPLFLTPLMQSAVDLGPFIKKDGHREIDSIVFENAKPAVYEYSNTYSNEEYSDMHAYYSNLYIVLGSESVEALDCYIMDCQVTPQADNPIKAVWYVNMADSTSTYTHCLLSEKFKKRENLEKLNHLINVLESREYNRDSELQGVWLKNSCSACSGSEGAAERVCIWKVGIEEKSHAVKKDREEIKKKIKETEERFKRADELQKNLIALDRESKKVAIKEERKLACNRKRLACNRKSNTKAKLGALHSKLREAMSERPNVETELIAFRNVNNTKSNLGAHNEILDAFISLYNH